MRNVKRNKTLGIVAICINVLLLLNSIYLLYAYSFTDRLFLFMYPNWVLLVNASLGMVGIYISILLFRNKIGLKLFLITTILFWLVALSNYFFPIF